MRLFLVRHGESVDNVAGLYAGSRDASLTNHGTLQARRLGAHLAAKATLTGPIVHVFASNLQRAVNTAKAVAEAQPCVDGQSALAVQQCAELREKDFGSNEGMHFGTRKANESKPKPVDFVDEESAASMQSRVSRFVDQHLLPVLREQDKHASSIVIVAHGIILNVLLRAILAHSNSTEAISAAWSNTGYVEMMVNHVSTSQVSASDPEQVDSQDTEAAQTVPAAKSKLVVKILETNCTEHLKTLKKTRGGIGSLKFDAKQRTVDSFFSRPAKKAKTEPDAS